jgi:hypothetical protein
MGGMNENGLQFHIGADDYFGTLATVLDLLRQEMEKRGRRKHHAQVLTRMTEELVYLQRNFRIVGRG